MTKKGLSRIVVCLSLFLFSVASAQAFSELIIFGDSLEDTGNFASLGGSPLPPPFFMNRITNGPVAADVLAEGLGLTAAPSLHFSGAAAGKNYAVAAARAHTAGLIDLTTQVGAFLLNHGGTAPPDALYLVGIGGNDVRDARDAPNNATARRIIESAADMTAMNLERLTAAGARNIMVLNLPDVGAIPETALIADMTGDKALIKKTMKKTRRFNRKLARRLKKLERALGIDFIEFDTFAFFNNILAHPAAFGLNNTTDACFSSVTFTFHPDCHFGASFDQFAYFDEIHPTGRVHMLWGKALLETVQSR